MGFLLNISIFVIQFIVISEMIRNYKCEPSLSFYNDPAKFYRDRETRGITSTKNNKNGPISINNIDEVDHTDSPLISIVPESSSTTNTTTDHTPPHNNGTTGQSLQPVESEPDRSKNSIFDVFSESRILTDVISLKWNRIKDIAIAVLCFSFAMILKAIFGWFTPVFQTSVFQTVAREAAHYALSYGVQDAISQLTNKFIG